jgi:uncharacterized membrane protein YjfL (UPF0719 family)
MNEYNLIEHVKTAVIFSLLGILLFGIVWFIVVKVSPFSIRKELEEDQNTALGIVLGCLILGISIIVAAAIHG